MITKPLKDIDAWISYFDHAEIPVLKRTQAELARFKRDEDDLHGNELADAVMHDPLMTLKVLQYLRTHRSKRQVMDITTIAKAIMMLGTTPFFRHFSRLPTIEEALRKEPTALEGAMRAMSRARHAALYAQDWAVVRHDIESDEVVIAALLRDLTEILMWCFAPTLMNKVHALLQANSRLRSADVQKHVFGFKGLDLQLALVKHWELPELLQKIMDEKNADQPRARNVSIACRLARHAANGWYDAGLPDDYKDAAKLLRLSEEELRQRVLRITLQATKSWTWYGVPPAATWLPMLPKTIPAPSPVAA